MDAGLSAEQEDVEAIREALGKHQDRFLAIGANDALDRLTGALERAERERDYAQEQREILHKILDASMTRAEKAERALGEAEMALMEIRNAAEAGGPGEMPARWFAERARAALRPSEASE